MYTPTRTMTAKELANMPDDGFRRELVKGELREMAPAGRFHGRYAMRIGASLLSWAETTSAGEVYAAETGFLLASDHVRAPDAAFVRAERLAEIGDADSFIPLAPDVAVEVVSPSDRYAEVNEKIEDWLDAGTRAVVVADPRRRIVSVHSRGAPTVTLDESDILEVGDAAPEWAMAVANIFA